MNFSTMYPAMPGSPSTVITGDISSSSTTISIEDSSALPVGPNLAVITDGENFEIILYSSNSSGSLTGVTRGTGDTTARSWSSGAEISRNFTSLDHNAIVSNVQSLENRITYGTTDLTPGTSTLNEGVLYFVIQ